ncbi:PREDICTED: uncharacterized protein LOC104747978 [Camelina sativa]|uniref:Uncharacterized protein LOC104747978 n=1 Tax=Camelina sativa TaxID=90675 RepID=A0ABM0WAB3_CAMSA|nr:PREDICTED: uncharacterized protein LOC104747978 [Camelina sativa]
MDGQPVKECVNDINNSCSIDDGEPTDEYGDDVDPGADECVEECQEALHDTTYEKPKDVDDMDFDYSEYGKFEDEDEDDDEVGDHSDVDVKEGKPFVGGIHGQLNIHWIDQLKVGQCFPCKYDVITEVRLTDIMLKFSFKIKKFTKSRLVAICSMPGCTWRVVATVKNDPTTFWVTKYLNVHTCSIVDCVSHRKRCTSKYIGMLIVDWVGIVDGVVPQHIEDSMRTMFGMTMDYTTSYRALQYALEYVRGNAKSGYAKLPYRLRKIEQSNSGSVVYLVVDDEHRFKYLFLSIDASIRGFNYVRRFIVVDWTHLTGRYEGVLLVSCAHDGNFQIFPLAFGIVDSECDVSWDWFFTKLNECISEEYPLVVVSDRCSSIAKACRNVMPWATQGICYYHLQQNIISNFRGKQLMYLVKGAAYAHTYDDYNRYMASLTNVNPALAAYLNEANPALWSRVYCPGDRYNIKTSNIAEFINSMLKKAKGYPITYLI